MADNENPPAETPKSREFPGKKPPFMHREGHADAIEGKVGDELLKAREAEYKALGFIGRPKEAIAQNWSHSKTGIKFLRGTGTAVGVVLMASGAKDLFTSKEPEEGKEGPSMLGRIVKFSAKEAAGLGAIYFSLVKGGKEAALRI